MALDLFSPKHLINIIGFSYSITVTYASIDIGCKSFTIDQLDEVFYELPELEVNQIKIIVIASLEIILENIANEKGE